MSACLKDLERIAELEPMTDFELREYLRLKYPKEPDDEEAQANEPGMEYDT